MNQTVENILQNKYINKDDIQFLLSLDKEGSERLFRRGHEIKTTLAGRKVFFRGLIEYSNICTKNCFYCGIRMDNNRYKRYTMSDEEVLETAKYAHDNNFASIVIQSGEQSSKAFSKSIENLLREIHTKTKGELHITLSLGEQTEETYKQWYNAGAHRYLLRIEVSNPALYAKLHPGDKRHTYNARLEALSLLRKTGYQVGTGVMIGLPFQTVSDLADDLCFFRDFDIDMVGMGPYIEHEDTPFWAYRDLIPSAADRVDLSIKMVAILRIIMPDINIAATTAMQTLDPRGRELAIYAGANVIMPNLTPVKYRDNYLLYENKPNVKDQPDETRKALEKHILAEGDEIGYGEWGDSRHFKNRNGKIIRKS
ncbi:MAG: [FeFe] hydrogenase H-cluster radical SAM maturase HydE [Bacteroidetes bacterium]|nr:[FeFe] hydrogenase H-cluster radical SAM maturase HydE [Bacteroidota bacterium]